MASAARKMISELDDEEVLTLCEAARVALDDDGMRTIIAEKMDVADVELEELHDKLEEGLKE